MLIRQIIFVLLWRNTNKSKINKECLFLDPKQSLEWFHDSCKLMHVLSRFSHVWLFVTLVDYSLPGSSMYWLSPGKSTGVGCHDLLQGIFPTQGSNPHLLHLLHCRWILYHWATCEALQPHRRREEPKTLKHSNGLTLL